MKTVFLSLFVALFLTSQVFSQDRFDEFKEYCAKHETILQQVSEPGMYGHIEIKEQHNLNGELLVYMYAFEKYQDSFVKEEVGTVQGGKTITPHIYLGSLNSSMQVGVIRIYSGGDIYGEQTLFLVDNNTKTYHLISVPGDFINKIVLFENGIIIEQESGSYHAKAYDKFYSYIRMENSTTITESYQRKI